MSIVYLLFLFAMIARKRVHVSRAPRPTCLVSPLTFRMQGPAFPCLPDASSGFLALTRTPQAQLQSFCVGEHSCAIGADLLADPCPGTSKYAKVSYTCEAFTGIPAIAKFVSQGHGSSGYCRYAVAGGGNSVALMESTVLPASPLTLLSFPSPVFAPQTT